MKTLLLLNIVIIFNRSRFIKEYITELKMSSIAGNFYEKYKLPKAISKESVKKMRKELQRYTNEKPAKKWLVNCVPSSPSVTIRIDTPTLRNSTPRGVAKKVAMPSQQGYIGKLLAPRNQIKKNELPIEKKIETPQKSKEVECTIVKLTVAQRKLVRQGTLSAKKLKETVEEESKEEARKKKAIIAEFLSPASKPVTRKEKAKKALSYVRGIGIKLKEILRTVEKVKEKNFLIVPQKIQSGSLPETDQNSLYYRPPRPITNESRTHLGLPVKKPGLLSKFKSLDNSCNLITLEIPTGSPESETFPNSCPEGKDSQDKAMSLFEKNLEILAYGPIIK